MKIILLIILFSSLIACTKPKTVFICGDHICINNSEAKQYFQENLSIEVQILETKKDKEPSLVELNIKNSNDKKQIFVKKKEKTNTKLKDLSFEEVKEIKRTIKEKKETAKIKNPTKKIHKKIVLKKTGLKKGDKGADICAILEKCNIDEISKYLIKKGKEKNFPDITIRE